MVVCEINRNMLADLLVLWSCVCRCTEFACDWITLKGWVILRGSDCLTSIYCLSYEFLAILLPRNSCASLQILFAVLSEKPWLHTVTAFYTITLLLPFHHVKFHQILVWNCRVLRRFYKITDNVCMKWYWSHFMAVGSDIDLVLWLYKVILISSYGCRKWHWSHVTAEGSDIDLVLWLYRVILISCYGCMNWYWSHFVAEWSDIDLVLWLYRVILISFYGWMKWYWSHAMAEWSDIDHMLWLNEVILISCLEPGFWCTWKFAVFSIAQVSKSFGGFKSWSEVLLCVYS